MTKTIADYMQCDCDADIRPMDTYMTDDGEIRNLFACTECGSMIMINSTVTMVSEIDLVATPIEEFKE